MASLGTAGIAGKGKYSADVAYAKGNFVYHNGSSWLALKDNLTGVTPEEGENWKYLARGYAAELLSMITALDTSGVLGEAGASVSAQSLIDYLTDSVMNNLVKKMDISNVQLNDQSKVPSSALAYAMQREVDKLNTQSDNLMMKITSGSMTETIGSLPTGKYSGYYSSGAADTPSNYGTFEAVVMNSSTATITAVDTSSGENYTKIKTSNTWKNWEKDITNSNLNGTGSSTVSHRTNAGGGWSSAKPSIVLEGTKGADEVIILSTMTVKDGKWYISASQKDNLLRFRYTSDSGGIVSQFSLDPDKKSAVWS